MNPFAQTRDDPDKPAIVVGEETMSYRELDLGSRAAASSLRRRGLLRGDVIAILSNGGFGGIYEKLPARLRELANRK